MIRLKNICKSFSHQEVLHNFQYQFSSTGFYLLFGPSGCGKTTLLNIIAGIWKCDSGECYYFDQPIEAVKAEYEQQISYITQDAYFVDYLTVMDNLKLCEPEEEQILQVLEKLQLSQVKSQYPSSLSGGERQRLAIARSLLLNHHIILLDEPTSALDKENRDIILTILQDLKQDHLLICVSHDVMMKAFCDEIIDFLHLEYYQEEVVKTIDEVKQEIGERKNPFTFSLC